jgi:uncharacterized membrane protein (UPF0136 family)
MKPETILWVYIVLLVLGGLIGFLKAKSKISLITSVAFAAALSVCALDKLDIRVAWGILSFLALFFLIRFLKNKKFMPGGMMTLLTIATIIVVVWIRENK